MITTMMLVMQKMRFSNQARVDDYDVDTDDKNDDLGDAKDEVLFPGRCWLPRTTSPLLPLMFFSCNQSWHPGKRRYSDLELTLNNCAHLLNFSIRMGWKTYIAWQSLMKSKINEGLLTVEAHGSLQLRMVRSVSFGCLPFSVPKRKHFTAELGGFDCSLFSWNDWLQVIYTFSKGNVFCVWLTAIYLIACNDRLCDEDIHMDLQSLWCAILVGGILHSHHCRTKMNGSIHSSVLALRGNQRTSGSWRQNAV